MAACLLVLVAGALSPSARGETSYSFGQGAWSWFGGPRALFHAGRHRATYAAWVAPSGRQVISSWDGRERVRTILPGYLPSDDHTTPALAVLNDGRIMIFSSRHNGRQLNTRVSVRPEDVTAWDRIRPLGTNTPGGRGYTYPNAITLRRPGQPLYLFWRGGDWLPAYSRYLGEGRWTHARHLFRAVGHLRHVRPYVKYATNGREIAVAFSDTHPRNGHSGVKFALLRNGTFFSSAGRRLSRRGRPLDVRKADVIRRPGRTRTWLQDVTLSPTGQPAVVWAAFPHPRRQHVYYYSTFWRGRWRTHRITSAGAPVGAVNRTVRGIRSVEIYYSGGIVLDPERPSVAYLSRKRGHRRSVERWSTRTNGRSWSHRPVSSPAQNESIRPVVPVGLPPHQRQVLWMSGTYLHYHHFTTDIRLSPVGYVPPTANFRLGQAATDGVVAFDPSGTRGGTTAVAHAAWDFGDGTSAPANDRIRHRYAGPGRYFPRLVVVDAQGRRDTLVREVTVP